MQANPEKSAQLSQLVTRAKTGDREAFDGLVELCAPQLYNVALRITGSREEAQDCVQEAFVRAFSALGAFRGEAAFSTWLYRVTVNVANDAARRRKREPLLASDLGGSESSEIPELIPVGRAADGGGDDPQDAAVESQRRRVILEAIHSLPEQQRIAIALYDLQGLSYEEIARITRCRVGTVKSRLNRARLALKGLLQEHMELLRE